jgi:NAD(P)H dehydrogenase (quinone)
MPDILILYYSQGGAVRDMARLIARGVEAVPGAQARLRTVPRVAARTQISEPAVPPSDAPYVTPADLEECAALALGSPTRFGNMAAAMKYFWDGTGAEWARGALVGKPACVFTSTATQHGGQESTLLTMMLPLLHHGMLIMGLPYTEATLNTTTSGGTPYGPSHVAGAHDDTPISDDEHRLCLAMGRRLASITRRLAGN